MLIKCWDVKKDDKGWATTASFACDYEVPHGTKAPQVIIHHGEAYVPSNQEGNYIHATSVIVR